MFKEATRQKRNAQGMVLSYDQINSNSEFGEDEENSLGNLSFSVECEEYSQVELQDLMDSLKLSSNEKIVASFLVKGMEKPDIAYFSGLNIWKVSEYTKRIGKKMILAGALV